MTQLTEKEVIDIIGEYESDNDAIDWQDHESVAAMLDTLNGNSGVVFDNWTNVASIFEGGYSISYYSDKIKKTIILRSVDTVMFESQKDFVEDFMTYQTQAIELEAKLPELEY